MSSGTGAQEFFFSLEADHKEEESRSLKEIKQPLCSPVVSTRAFCLCVFQAVKAFVLPIFFSVCFLQNGRSLGIALHCLYKCSICRDTLFFHQSGGKTGRRATL